MSPEHFMRESFRLALRGKGRVSPNPMVGAVLVRNGRVIASGFHERFGEAHAEVNCLRGVPGDLSDATLYVNLEPCSHQGKTPPCVDLIVSRQVGSVVASMADPNPLVAGRGLRRLRRAGIKTTVGLLEEEARALNRVFITHITASRPYVHVKIAESSDGRITGGRSRWISSPESRRRVHALRAEYDAVLVGAGTIRADDPMLTVRLVKGRNPDAVILDGAFSLPLRKKLFAPDSSRRRFLFTTRAALQRNPEKAEALSARGVTVVGLPGKGGRFDMREVLVELHSRDVASVLVEGGAGVFTQFLSGGLADEVTLFIAPEFFGKGLAAFEEDGLRDRFCRKPESVAVNKSGRDRMVNILFKQTGS